MSHDKEQFHAHADFIFPQSEDSADVIGHIHGDEGMSADEIRHRIAEEYDSDPANITVFDPLSGEKSFAPSGDYRRIKSWGFSNWGAKWEPAGPKGNPNLN